MNIEIEEKIWGIIKKFELYINLNRINVNSPLKIKSIKFKYKTYKKLFCE
jgi:hypothetical protein